jgi:hypothetical protein
MLGCGPRSEDRAIGRWSELRLPRRRGPQQNKKMVISNRCRSAPFPLPGRGLVARATRPRLNPGPFSWGLLVRAGLWPVVGFEFCRRVSEQWRLGVVAIYQLLRTLSLGREDIAKLTTAYEDALRILQLSNRTDPITTIIAERIIEAAKTGVRDPAQLCRLAIEDLKVP